MFGTCSYKTTLQRLTLTAKERVLRCDDEHPWPCSLAVDTTTNHRLVRSSFKSTAKELEVKHIPVDAHNRLPIELKTPQPWGNKKQVEVNTTLDASDPQKSHLTNTELPRPDRRARCRLGYLHGWFSSGEHYERRKRRSYYQQYHGLLATPACGHNLQEEGQGPDIIILSYEEEAAAMESAFEWVENNISTPSTKILVCTDSQSLYQNFSDPLFCTVVDLRDRIRKD